MENLLLEFPSKINRVTLDIQRYLVSEIDLNNRLIAIKGTRGSGKTTLLLQIAKLHLPLSNITKISEKVGVSRNMLVQCIKILERAGLVNKLYRDNSGIGVLTKPEKLFLKNSNLMYALAKENTNVGNVRETFFLHQFKGLQEINLSPTADFVIDQTYTFEIGG